MSDESLSLRLINPLAFGVEPMLRFSACLLAIAGLTAGRSLTVAFAEDHMETLQVEGLHAPVEILIDRWGIAHIEAASERDLFFAQGYHAASRRLFQFELWRRQATGTVSEILGKRELQRDIGARLLRYRGDMTQELNHYHPRGAAIIGAFVEGINAFVAATERNPALLPIEFRLLECKPGRWTPEVVVSRHQGLMHNVLQELALTRAVARIGEKKVKELVWLHPGPGEPDLTIDPAIDTELLSADVLALYRAARSPIEFRPEDVLPEFRAKTPAQSRVEPATWSERYFAEQNADWRDLGSNNWVVSGRLTESGAAIMANDPHRALQLPSLRYLVHLKAPGWNVIGGGEPVLPGISIGHNEYGAWGLTIFRIDAEDLYVYETHPDDANRYRYRDGWEAMTIVQESIPVKGEAAAVVELKFTRHGPVLYEDARHRVAYALRAGWLDQGGAPYLASLRMNEAKNWDEFREACSYSRIPGENMVWADREGNIGWQAVGVAPLRANWSGLVAVPGDGRYEWGGYLPIKALPHVLNPDKGFWNTSNENLVPPDYEHRPAVAWTWADPFRGARVHEVLASGRKLSAMDMMQLQQDELSIPARTLVPLLRDLSPENSAQREAIGRLRNWDFVLDRDSTAAGIYVMWERKLSENLHKLAVPENARKEIEDLSMKRMIEWLLSPDGKFGEHPLSGRDGFLRASLQSAIDELTRRFGPDMAKWQYGQSGYKHALIRHPLSPAVNDELRKQLDVGPLPRGGNSYTANNTGDKDNQPSGGSFRVIVDVGNWDAALATNSPGQGGDPQDAAYANLFDPWAKGRYFPMFYSPEKIEAACGKRLHLQPAATR